MKKKLSVLLAGVFSAAAVCGMVACGDGYDDSVFDREAKAFDSADVNYLLSGKTDKDDELSVISDTLFGVFLEDINFASYALTSNLVANGSFDAITKEAKYGWSAANATLTVESGDGIFKGTDYASVNPNYAKVTAQAGGYVSNLGYDAVPMAVTKDTDYIFSAFIKAPSAVTMTVSVTDGTTAYAEQSVDLLAQDGWVKYTRTLKATASASEGLSLRLSFDSAATVYLDGVSLDTTDSTVGIKNYLYNAIADLSPKFVRFPGGCITEGNGAVGEEGAFDWKNSVGAVALSDGTDKVPAFTYKANTDGTLKDVTTYGEAVTRKHNPDLWVGSSYYDMDYALGFYEYFLLCESLGASAVPVVSCGLSCQGGAASNAHSLRGRHGNGVDDFIQDAKDLIAFAKGSVNSADANEKYWAQVRTDLGHPEPFDMEYIGIGNEQFGSIYFNDHYEKFLEAFKDESNDLYRSVKPIVGNAMHFSDCQQPAKNIKGEAQTYAESYMRKGKIDAVSEYGVHDQHYYMSYVDFFTNAYLYDSYYNASIDDLYYEVFVGEYSANESTTNGGKDFSFNGTNWRNSWITALSEAAMMTCYERNGDIIKLAAYAPMFAPVKAADRQWAVDMMYFTNTEIVCSTNYYVQQLFMQNQGRYKLEKSGAEYADGFDTKCTLVGANSNNTQEIDKLYYVASMDENGDLILKIVNASAEPVKLNVKISDANVRKLANVTVLQNDSYKAVNTLGDTQISPENYTIGGWEGDTLGYEAGAYSVTCIRVLAK